MIDIDCQQTDTVHKGAGSQTEAAREREREGKRERAAKGALNNAA